MIRPASLDGVHIFFPDPWPKQRHHKRRLIQSPFVALVVGTSQSPAATCTSRPTGTHYAEQVLAVLGAEPRLANTARGYAPRPDYRPLTRFEQRGLRLGHDVYDIVFRRV